MHFVIIIHGGTQQNNYDSWHLLWVHTVVQIPNNIYSMVHELLPSSIKIRIPMYLWISTAPIRTNRTFCDTTLFTIQICFINYFLNHFIRKEVFEIWEWCPNFCNFTCLFNVCNSHGKPQMRDIKKVKSMSINIIKLTPNWKEIPPYQIADFHFQYPRKNFKKLLLFRVCSFHTKIGSYCYHLHHQKVLFQRSARSGIQRKPLFCSHYGFAYFRFYRE